MNMIERVARAINSNYPHGLNCSVPNCLACAGANKDTELQAKSAIQAMREPSEEMIKAGFGNQDVDAWRLMIDAALKE